MNLVCLQFPRKNIGITLSKEILERLKEVPDIQDKYAHKDYLYQMTHPVKRLKHHPGIDELLQPNRFFVGAIDQFGVKLIYFSLDSTDEAEHLKQSACKNLLGYSPQFFYYDLNSDESIEVTENHFSIRKIRKRKPEDVENDKDKLDEVTAYRVNKIINILTKKE